MCPHCAQHRDVFFGSTLTTTRPALSAFSRISLTNVPHPASAMLRFKPDLAATFRPGSSTVPFAERSMLRITNASTAIPS
jgi:hypothetical protein